MPYAHLIGRSRREINSQAALAALATLNDTFDLRRHFDESRYWRYLGCGCEGCCTLKLAGEAPSKRRSPVAALLPPQHLLQMNGSASVGTNEGSVLKAPPRIGGHRGRLLTNCVCDRVAHHLAVGSRSGTLCAAPCRTNGPCHHPTRRSR